MNLIGLEFRKHLLQYRVVLIMFASVLLIDLAIVQEWFGGAVVVYPFYSGPNLLAQGTLPLAFVLPIIMLMDCPNWNSFAQTRPISPRELWLGKWLFLGLVVLTRW
jgi:hypothetical protein